MKSNNKPLLMAIFLVTVGLFSRGILSPKSGITQEKGVYTGPSFVKTAQANTSLPAVVGADTDILATGNLSSGEDEAGLPAEGYAEGAVQAPAAMPSNSILATSSAILENNATQVSLATGTLPNFNKNFILPTQGHNWGILHNYNAVDIANQCGTPVVAAADGLVVPDQNISDTLGGWNGGYGNFVLLEHAFGNNISTRYAHLEKIEVKIGDYVKQGQEIGLMGETGDATGCHLHFEVIGAKNPFAKK